MSKEGDHHYIPQFHLRKWEGVDGKLLQWGRIAHNNKLVCTRVTTAQTAYVPGLYSLRHVLPEQEQQIEIEVFGKIETETAPVLEKLIVSGASSLSVKDRYWWTRYLIASTARVPHRIEKLRSDTNEVLSKEFSKADYTAIKGDAVEETILEFAQNHAPARLANLPMKVLVGALDKERTINRIINLNWIVRDVASATRRLMLGDDPYERIGDLFKRRTLISIPLSPTHIFIGTDTTDVIDSIMGKTAREIASMSNISALSTANKFAYGEAAHDFVQRYFLPAAPADK